MALKVPSAAYGRNQCGAPPRSPRGTAALHRMVAVGACSGPASLAASGLLSIKGWGIP